MTSIRRTVGWLRPPHPSCGLPSWRQQRVQCIGHRVRGAAPALLPAGSPAPMPAISSWISSGPSPCLQAHPCRSPLSPAAAADGQPPAQPDGARRADGDAQKVHQPGGKRAACCCFFLFFLSHATLHRARWVAAPGPHSACTVTQPRAACPQACATLRYSLTSLPCARRAFPFLQGSPDTYAVMTLYDPHRKPIPNIEYRTGARRASLLPAVLPFLACPPARLPLPACLPCPRAVPGVLAAPRRAHAQALRVPAWPLPRAAASRRCCCTRLPTSPSLLCGLCTTLFFTAPWPCRGGHERGLPALQPAEGLCECDGCALSGACDLRLHLRPARAACAPGPRAWPAQVPPPQPSRVCGLPAAANPTCAWTHGSIAPRALGPNRRVLRLPPPCPPPPQPPPRCRWLCTSSRAPWMPSPPSRSPSCKRRAPAPSAPASPALAALALAGSAATVPCHARPAAATRQGCCTPCSALRPPRPTLAAAAGQARGHRPPAGAGGGCGQGGPHPGPLAPAGGTGACRVRAAVQAHHAACPTPAVCWPGRPLAARRSGIWGRQRLSPAV